MINLRGEVSLPAADPKMPIGMYEEGEAQAAEQKKIEVGRESKSRFGSSRIKLLENQRVQVFNRSLQHLAAWLVIRISYQKHRRIRPLPGFRRFIRCHRR